MFQKIKTFGSRLMKLSTVSKTRTFWLVAGLIVLCSGGFLVYQSFFGSNQGAVGVLAKWFNQSEDITYLTVPVTKETITDVVQATGTLEPVRKVELSFKNVGEIKTLNIQEGDRVKAGQLLAEQDPRDLNVELNQAERDIAQNEIQIQKLIISQNKALKTLTQQRELLAAGIIAQDELDQAQDDYANSELDLASAKSQLENSQARLEVVRNDLAATKLIAPFAGIASLVNGDVGQRSGGGDGSGVNAFITIISDDLQVTALVNEVDIGRIKVDQKVEFTSTAYPETIFQGEVLKISAESTTVSNVQFYEVLLSANDPDRLLHPGMSAAVSIIKARKNEVPTVPMLALTYAESYLSKNSPAAARAGTNPPGETLAAVEGRATEGTAENERNSPSNRNNSTNRKAIVILEGGLPVVKYVEVGLNDGQNIEIVEGLQLGEAVVIGTNQTGASASGSAASSSRTTNSTPNRTGNPMGPGGPF